MAINLFKRYVSDKELNECPKPEQFRRMTISLALLHGSMVERNSYVPHGWNNIYDWHPSDFVSCKNVVKDMLKQPTPLNFNVLKYLIAEVVYGGRLTDDKDRRLGNSITSC